MISRGGLTRGAQAGAGLALAAAGLHAVGNPDTFGHLAQGRQIAELGTVPRVDTWSFWQPEPAAWTNYEWLSDVLTWWAFSAGSWSGLLAVKCTLLALSGVLLVELARRCAGARAAVCTALLCVAAIPGARFRFSARPHLVALPLAALYLLGAHQLLRPELSRRASAAWLAGLTVAHVAWVNLHGSHLLGIGLTGLALLVSVRDTTARVRLGALLALQATACLVSPYGPAIVFDALAHVFDPAYRSIVREWAGNDASVPTWLVLAPWLWALALALSARGLLRSGSMGRLWLGTSLVLLVLALRSVRFRAEFLLLSSPAVAVGLAPWLTSLEARRAALLTGATSLALAVGVPLGSARLPPLEGPGVGVNWQRLPLASGRWLDEHMPKARLLAAMEDAWFVLWVAPSVRVLQDGRVPFYGPDHMTRVAGALASPARLRPLLAEYDVDTVLLQHTFAGHARVLAMLAASAEWKLAHVEDMHVLWVRQDRLPRSAPVPHALPPVYDPVGLLTSTDHGALLRDLARLPAGPTTRGYAGWIRGMALLAPFARAGGRDGFRRPATHEELNSVNAAADALTRTAAKSGGVPAVEAYRGLALVNACRLDEAQEAFRAATRESGSREALLGSQELALRRGHRDAVAAFLTQARAVPGAAGDGWLAALAHDMTLPVDALCLVANGRSTGEAKE